MSASDRLAEAVQKHLDWGPKTQSDRYYLDTKLSEALAAYRSAPPVDIERCAHAYRPLIGGCRCEKCGHQIAWDARLVPPVDIEALVDAVGAALGVDTGACHENQFRAACDAARAVLRKEKNDD